MRAGSTGNGRWGERAQGGCAQSPVLWLQVGTFAGADHLEHHLGSPAVVQARLLVQQPLLFHLLLLGWGGDSGAGEAQPFPSQPHLLQPHPPTQAFNQELLLPLAARTSVCLLHLAQGWA